MDAADRLTPVYYDSSSLRDLIPEVSEEIADALAAGLELHPEKRVGTVEEFADSLGTSLGAVGGESLALSLADPGANRALLEAIVRTAAGVFEASAASIALTDEDTGELVFQAAWGTGADEIVGVRLAKGAGIAGAIAASGRGEAIPRCREDQRFSAAVAEGTGYVPLTMVVAPLVRNGAPIGTLSLLDRRDGGAYGAEDLERARMFADLTVTALSAT